MAMAFRLALGKYNLRLLFLATVAGQAIALGIGLWLEQRLLDSLTPVKARSSAKSASTTAPRDFVPLVKSALPANYSTTIKVTAFFWICCAQAAIAYLIMARWNANRIRQETADAKAYAQQNHDLLRTRDAVIFGLAKLAESRDPDTGHHLERIALYSTRLAEALRRHPRFAAEINSTFMKLLGVSSALHDIGKVGVEDAILLKPGALTDTERLKIQQHTLFGGRCIEQIESRLGASNFLAMAREIALYHHERWDGTGYPYGKRGTDIPLAARIIAVADVYDALSVRRVYKEPFRHEKCVNIIREGAGTQFDPQIVEVFLTIESEFERFAAEMSDITYSDQQPPNSQAEVMTPEQERILERVLTAEKFCTRDSQLVSAGGSPIQSYGASRRSSP